MYDAECNLLVIALKQSCFLLSLPILVEVVISVARHKRPLQGAATAGRI